MLCPVPVGASRGGCWRRILEAMDTSKKQHFDIFSTVESTVTKPLGGEDTIAQPCGANHFNSHLQEHNTMPRSKPLSIGMLTNNVHQELMPCFQHKLSSCRQWPAPVKKLPLRDCANHSVIKIVKNDVMIVPKTPPKSNISLAEPVTPTSNLKLLTDLASRENVHHCEDIENEFNEEDSENIPADVLKYTSRKDKSLGLLTAKFLSQYPEYPPVENITEISLDKASKDLNVGRRRIYDVVNVLEAVQIVKKCAKNVYAWLGKTNLNLTLARFKKLAEQENLIDQLSSLSSLTSQEQLNGLLKECSNSSTTSSSESSSTNPIKSESPAVEGSLCVRKEKSLGMMSQKFMMLLLVSHPRVISLDLAARFLIGESGVDDKSSTVYKTKMRRLYSITHVLTSLALIEKVDNVETRGSRKPAYKYIGPNFDGISSTDLNDFENALQALQSSPILLAKRPLTEDVSASSNLKRVKLPRTKSESVIRKSSSNLNEKSLPRRSSLQEVCKVAEEERRKLLFPITQRALEMKKEPQQSIAPEQGCSTATKPIYTGRTSTAILLTSNGTPLKVISVSSSPDGSSMLRLVPSTSSDENGSEVKTEKSEIPLVQLPLVLQFDSESNS